MKRTIIALGAIALALALAGGAWAGKTYLITSSSQVKPGSLTGKNVKNHSLGLNESEHQGEGRSEGRARPAGPAGRHRRDGPRRGRRATRETRETPVRPRTFSCG